MPGKRNGTFANNQSTAAAMLAPNSTVTASGGAPSDAVGVVPDEPKCRQSTVSVSSHARKNGSQWSEYSDGKPILSGDSVNETARNPRSALRRISAAAISGSSSHGSCSGML